MWNVTHSKSADGSVIISSSAAIVPEKSSLTLTCTYTGNDQRLDIANINSSFDITDRFKCHCLRGLIEEIHVSYIWGSSTTNGGVILRLIHQ
ncbi:hypothetical protein MAR_021829 [Mya arenaria]|uniref:Ig-like domain-containing protein n=1 Tax=Mya arenaria TaxID=6604 RepID=A0ABY7EBS3_MYAAR|nr:hypothetical protein MAR_021829 [Mya arenaria]